MYCHNCGTSVPDGANFCGKCGEQVHGPQVPAGQDLQQQQGSQQPEGPDYPQVPFPGGFQTPPPQGPPPPHYSALVAQDQVSLGQLKEVYSAQEAWEETLEGQGEQYPPPGGFSPAPDQFGYPQQNVPPQGVNQFPPQGNSSPAQPPMYQGYVPPAPPPQAPVKDRQYLLFLGWALFVIGFFWATILCCTVSLLLGWAYTASDKSAGKALMWSNVALIVFVVVGSLLLGF